MAVSREAGFYWCVGSIKFSDRLTYLHFNRILTADINKYLVCLALQLKVCRHSNLDKY